MDISKKWGLRNLWGQIQWKPLAVSLGISLGVEALSGLLTSGSMDIYEKIYKPPLAPPGWIFPVVWTVLFILMGISAYLVYVKAKQNSGLCQQARSAFFWYAAQLVINMGWSLIFFVLHAYLLAFAWLLLLWYLVFVTACKFYKISPLAGKLMIPYLVWLTFAAYLNLAIAVHYTAF